MFCIFVIFFSNFINYVKLVDVALEREVEGDLLLGDMGQVR